MIDRFNWSVCIAIALMLKFMLSPVVTSAADEILRGGAEPGNATSGELALPDSPSQKKTSERSDSLRQVPERIASEKYTLNELLGMVDIPVLADINGQLVKALTENQIMDEASASKVAETNLLESISSGRSFSRDSLAALSRTEQAKAQTGQALGLLLPSVSVRGNRGYEISEPSVVIDPDTGELQSYSKHMRTDASLIATQPLFDLPAFMEWRRRKVKEQSREESYRVSDSDAYLSTVNSYLSLVSSRLQVAVTQDFETKLSELLSYIEKRAGAGAASVSDMSRVQARSQAMLSTRLEQESAHAAAGTDFVRLTNIVPQKVRLPVLDDVGASVLPESFDLAVKMAMISNPEIAVLTAELQAAKIDQSASKGKFLPTLDAEYTDTYSDHAGGSPDSQRDRRMMLVLQWNLLSGGKDVSYYDELTARRSELLYRLDEQRRRIIQALSANYAALATTGQRIDSGYQELQSISTAADAMSKRMLSGNQSLLDLLDVLNQSYQVRSRLVDLHTLEMNTVAQLIRLTQGAPWPAPPVVEQVQDSPMLTDPDWNEAP